MPVPVLPAPGAVFILHLGEPVNESHHGVVRHIAFVHADRVDPEGAVPLLQNRHKQWYFGKSLDGFLPMGPCIATVDSIPYPPKLAIRSRVNGELRQDSNTELLIFGIDHVVSELSQGMTLKPGTIIATGTPAGVGMGFDPPRFLKPGDVVECSVEGIGTIKNTVLE